MARREYLEVTDLLVDIGADGVRRELRRDDLVDRAIAAGDRGAARLISELPAKGGLLDPVYVDRLMVAVHREIQRLAEEFRHGARMATHLAPILAALRRGGVDPPYRVADVGCGSGYVVRWLAANRPAPDVEYIGVDLNPALVDAATELAALEGLDCRFVASNVFELEEPMTVLISTGVLHHFRGGDLERFFAAHQHGSVRAFTHVDFQPSWLAPLGSWLFHHTRMRLGVSRHDGVRSAQRAYSVEALAESVRAGASGYEAWVSRAHVRHTPFPCVLTTLVGVDGELASFYVSEMGSGMARLERLP